MNCDAGVWNKHAIAAFVIINSQGKVMAAEAVKLEFTTVLEGEFIALELGLQRIANQSWSGLHIESDSSIAVSAIQNGAGGDWSWGSRLKACRKVISQSGSLITHVPRMANTVAHKLVEWVKVNQIFGCLVNYVSEFCTDLSLGVINPVSVL